MNLKELLKNKIEKLTDEADVLRRFMALIREEEIELETGTVSLGYNTIDIDNPSRKDVEKLIVLLRAGKWEKYPVGDKMNYTTVDDYLPGYKLRLYCAAPPGSCRIIEEEVFVPAVPAHYKKKTRIECTPV